MAEMISSCEQSTVFLSERQDESLKTLDEIGQRHGTDKSSRHHNFLSIYENRLARFSGEFNLLEIGVYDGGSVKTWAEFYPHAKIVGLDIDPRCAEFEGGNIIIRIGDQSSVEFLFEVVSEFGRPNIVIDDGSHRWDHQIMSFQILFPLLQPGGTYIVEDLDTSFDGHLKQAAFDGLSQISAYDYLVKLGRVVTGDAALHDEKPYDLFIASNYLNVESIEFARRTCLIRKRPFV